MTILNHIDYLKEYKDKTSDMQIPKDLLTFYTSLFTIQYQATNYFSSLIHNSTIVVDTTHYPMVSPQTFTFTDAVISYIQSLYNEIATCITSFHKNYSFAALLQNLEKDPDLYTEILSKLLVKDDTLQAIAHSNAIDTEELVFISMNVYKPLFVALRTTAITQPTFADHTDAWCPFCGFLPDMAKIVESKNSKRILHCALCECEWEYNRVKCVSCGNENSATLGYYSYEPDEKYRFDYCDTCNVYIKTLRIPKQYDESRFDLTVENIITTFLDASALQMGYNRL